CGTCDLGGVEGAEEPAGADDRPDTREEQADPCRHPASAPCRGGRPPWSGVLDTRHRGPPRHRRRGRGRSAPWSGQGVTVLLAPPDDGARGVSINHLYANTS